MKKSFLLASLITATAIAAGTTGKLTFESNVKADFSTKTELNKPTFSLFSNGTLKTTNTHTATIENVSVSTEITLKDTGLSFGGTFKAKDLVIFTDKKNSNGQLEPENKKLTEILNDVNAWAKYELPQMNDVNSYLKLTYKNLNKVNFEGDINYDVNGVKVGLTSNTTLPIVYTETNDFSSTIESEHKVYVTSNELSVLNDVNAEIKIANTYNKINVAQDGTVDVKEVLKKGIKFVSGSAKVKYNKVEGLDLNANANFKFNFSDTKLEFKHEDEKLFQEFNGNFMHDYNFNATYTGLKNAKFVFSPFFAHLGLPVPVAQNNLLSNIWNILGNSSDPKEKKDFRKSSDTIIYGTKAAVGYVSDIFELTATAKIARQTKIDIDEEKENENDKKKYTNSEYYALGSEAKLFVTNNLTVTPEFKATVKTNEVVNLEQLTLTPKISSEYAATSDLTLKGSVEFPVELGKINNYVEENNTIKENGQKLGYKSNSVKAKLNIEYKW